MLEQIDTYLASPDASIDASSTLVILSVGGNDVFAEGITPEQTVAGYEHAVDTLYAKGAPGLRCLG